MCTRRRSHPTCYRLGMYTVLLVSDRTNLRGEGRIAAHSDATRIGTVHTVRGAFALLTVPPGSALQPVRSGQLGARCDRLGAAHAPRPAGRLPGAGRHSVRRM